METGFWNLVAKYCDISKIPLSTSFAIALLGIIVLVLEAFEILPLTRNNYYIIGYIFWLFFLIVTIINLWGKWRDNAKMIARENEKHQKAEENFSSKVQFLSPEEFAIILFCCEKNIQRFKVTCLNQDIVYFFAAYLFSLQKKEMIVAGYYTDPSQHEIQEMTHIICDEVIDIKGKMLEMRDEFHKETVAKVYRLCEETLYDSKLKPKNYQSFNSPNTKPRNPFLTS